MKVTIAQLDINDDNIEQNADKIIRVIQDNKDNDLIVFPELCLTGFPKNPKAAAQKYSLSMNALERITAATQSINVSLILGHIQKSGADFYNAAYLIHDAKHHVLYQKAQLWLDDVGVFTPGTLSSLTQIGQFTVGSQICFDLEFPEGSRNIAKQGADIIAMPNGNMRPYGNVHWILSQARAIENQLFVVTCNRVGSGHGGEFVGESLAVSPTGERLVTLGDKEEVTTVTLQKEEIEVSRKAYKYINYTK